MQKPFIFSSFRRFLSATAHPCAFINMVSK